jgi:hypothetical protein
MKQLFLFAIGLSAAAAPDALCAQETETPAPRFLCFEQLSVAMDTIAEGDVPSAVFSFRVCDSFPVLIRQVWPGCGCTVPDFPQDTLFPGKTYTARLNYHSYGRPGAFNRSAIAMYHSLNPKELQPNAEVSLNIHGFVLPKPKEAPAGE